MTARPVWLALDAYRCWLLAIAAIRAKGDAAERERLYEQIAKDHGV